MSNSYVVSDTAKGDVHSRNIEIKEWYWGALQRADPSGPERYSSNSVIVCSVLKHVCS